MSRRWLLAAGSMLAAVACSGEPVDPDGSAAITATMPTPPESAPASPEDQDVDRVTPADATTLRILRTSDAGLPVIAIEVAGERFDVEIAADLTARSRGMSGRDRFPSGTGMLFVHSDDQPRRYWMKDCLVDMDIAFIDRQGRVVALHQMPYEPPRRPNEPIATYHARLPGYPSRRPARYALELPFGDFERLGIRLGHTLPLPRAALDDLAAREQLGAGRR